MLTPATRDVILQALSEYVFLREQGCGTPPLHQGVDRKAALPGILEQRVDARSLAAGISGRVSGIRPAIENLKTGQGSARAGSSSVWVEASLAATNFRLPPGGAFDRNAASYQARRTCKTAVAIYPPPGATALAAAPTPCYGGFRTALLVGPALSLDRLASDHTRGDCSGQILIGCAPFQACRTAVPGPIMMI